MPWVGSVAMNLGTVGGVPAAEFAEKIRAAVKLQRSRSA